MQTVRVDVGTIRLPRSPHDDELILLTQPSPNRKRWKPKMRIPEELYDRFLSNAEITFSNDDEEVDDTDSAVYQSDDAEYYSDVE